MTTETPDALNVVLAAAAARAAALETMAANPFSILNAKTNPGAVRGWSLNLSREAESIRTAIAELTTR